MHFLIVALIFRLQTECAHYRMVGDDAYKQLLDIQTRDILSQSQNVRLRDWLDLMEEVSVRWAISYLRVRMCGYETGSISWKRWVSDGRYLISESECAATRLARSHGRGECQMGDILSQSQNVRLRDWLDLMEEVSVRWAISYLRIRMCDYETGSISWKRWVSDVRHPISESENQK